MDNQFYQPGGQPPVGNPQQGYTGNYGAAGDYGMPVPGVQPNPYDQLQGTPYAPAQPANPYDQLQGTPYAPAQPANPYDQLQQGTPSPVQTPYGGVAQPYADPGAMQAPYSDGNYQHLFPQGPEQAAPQQNVPQQTAPVKKSKLRRGPFAGGDANVPGKGKSRFTPSDIALIVVAAVAIMALAGWYLYATYAPEAARYGQVATGSLSAIHTGSVLVVRNEMPYDAESVNSVSYEAVEGSKVVRNDVICSIYSTGYSASAVRQLQQYRDDIRDYQEKLIEESTIYDAQTKRYNEQVLTLALELRSVISGDSGSMANIESQMTQTVSQRQSYFDQKFASEQRFSTLKDNERSQNQRINSWTHTYKATTDALVSFYSDGFEYAINGGNYTTFTPSQVRQMINGQKPENAAPGKGKTTLYRMVKDNEWYALFLSDDTAWNPVSGETYQLQLERFGDTTVEALVYDFEKSDGELLVRLRIIGSVEPVLYLRSCDAVLAESMTTLMVNERAIHTQDGTTGVWLVDGSMESFIPVNVLYTVDGYAYFQTVQQAMIFEGDQLRLRD